MKVRKLYSSTTFGLQNKHTEKSSEVENQKKYVWYFSSFQLFSLGEW